MRIPNLQNIEAMGEPELRRPAPRCWNEVSRGPCDSRRWVHEDGDRSILASTDVMDDGSRWLHVSISRSDRLPTWDEVREMKDHFIGRKHEAIQVLPSEDDYVNVNSYCLHLWSPIQ